MLPWACAGLNPSIHIQLLRRLQRSELTDPAFGEQMYRYEAAGIVASVAKHLADKGSADARKDR